MVGVPGRSKACHSCRQRKIACGLERPQCSQCLKSNLLCPGYHRDRIFVNAGTKSGVQIDLTKLISRASIRDNEKKATAVSKRTGSWDLIAANRETLPVPDGLSSREIVPQALYRHQLLSAFLSRYIPASHFGFSKERSWLALTADLPAPTRALDFSITALCMARLGREDDDLALVRESLGVYTRGLCEMQKALWDPQLMYRDETLGACMALAMYELVECPAANRRAYASHQDGCAKLVELRGAEAHRSGLGHQIFLTFRKQSLAQILQALDRHDPTYLATSSWMSKPWSTHSKHSIDKLFDFLSLAPAIFRQADKLDDMNPRDAAQEIIRLVDQCWKMNTALEQFYAELEITTLGPLYWPELSKENSSLDDVETGKVFPVAFHFLNLNMATTLMYYWSTLLMLWSGLCRLYLAISTLDLPCQDDDCDCILPDEKAPDDDNKLFSHKLDTSRRLLPLGKCSNFPAMARNICQSVEYCMQECMLGLGPSAVSAPLAIVIDTLKVLPGYDREVAWAKAVMARVATRGLRILKF